MKILMVAAENGALPGGKVGGIGDVIRDLPRALATRGHHVTVVTPGYGYFSRLPNAEILAQAGVAFGERAETVSWHRVRAPVPSLGVECRAVEHGLFAAGGRGRIYCDDPPERPFATDAGKFALFCLAVAQGLVDGILPRPDVLHLHDWHAALLALLCRHDDRYRSLADIPLVYTIHNLSLQGIRPLDGDASSLAAWLPGVAFPLQAIVDPRYDDCFNPTRAAISLCDKIHAVSPTYAREILEPTDVTRGFIGGEGLESDLQQAAQQGRLVGILNGVNYPEVTQPRLPAARLIAHCAEQVEQWLAEGEWPSHVIAARRLAGWRRRPGDSGMLLTSIGRITSQKLSLLLQLQGDQRTLLEHLLDLLDDDGRLLMLGRGDPVMEQRLTEIARHRDNFLYLRGYAESLGPLLYSSGDLFLMPSAFEPCGISQMLAMRSGQPCLVHGVGGLRDTVTHGVTGFVFAGGTPSEQAISMLASVREAQALWRADRAAWEALCERAARQRFSWEAAVQQIEQSLYTVAVRGGAGDQSFGVSRGTAS